jgi:hypothetical protein
LATGGRLRPPGAAAKAELLHRLPIAPGHFPRAHHSPGSLWAGLRGSRPGPSCALSGWQAKVGSSLRHGAHRIRAINSGKFTAPLRSAPYPGGDNLDPGGGRIRQTLLPTGQSVAGLLGFPHRSTPATPCPGETRVAGDLCMSAAHRACLSCITSGSGPECGQLWGPCFWAILWGPQKERPGSAPVPDTWSLRRQIRYTRGTSIHTANQSGAPPDLIHQAAGSARGPVRAIVVSSRTPAPRTGWCNVHGFVPPVGGVAAPGTGAAAAAPRALPRAPFRQAAEA